MTQQLACVRQVLDLAGCFGPDIAELESTNALCQYRVQFLLRFIGRYFARVIKS
jgi:hypothetical protein